MGRPLIFRSRLTATRKASDMCRGHRLRARKLHQKHMQSRVRQLHYVPNGDPEPEQSGAQSTVAEGILDAPEDPDDPLLEPVLHRGPHENGDATKPPVP
jgi:hypothetical protein